MKKLVLVNARKQNLRQINPNLFNHFSRKIICIYFGRPISPSPVSNINCQYHKEDELKLRQFTEPIFTNLMCVLKKYIRWIGHVNICSKKIQDVTLHVTVYVQLYQNFVDKWISTFKVISSESIGNLLLSIFSQLYW